MSFGVGIVGYGPLFAMGRHHAEAIRRTQGLALVGIYDADPERRRVAREEQPDVKVYDTYEDLLGDGEVSLVVLVTPHHTHHSLSVQASRAGKHVVTEKVMCLSVREADEMMESARQAGKMLTVYQNRRWDGDFLAVKRLWESGALGRVFSVQSCVNGFFRPAGWRAEKRFGGGMLYDWGAHLIDQVLTLFAPEKPLGVYATLYYGGQDVDVETQATVILNFSEGRIALVDVGCVSYLHPPRWVIRGEQGAVIMHDWENGSLRQGTQGDPVETPIKAEPSAWEAFYQNVSRHLNDGEELAVKPEEARLTVQVIESAFESDRLRKWIPLTP